MTINQDLGILSYVIEQDLHDMVARTRGQARLRLREPVGDRRPNQPDDVAAIEGSLRQTGDLSFARDREPTGLFSVSLRDGIRRFQRRRKLFDDAVVNPAGPTEAALSEELDALDANEQGEARNVDCARLANRVRNAQIELDKWMAVAEDDELRVADAEDRVQAAREAVDLARSAAGIVDRIGRGSTKGALAGLVVEGLDVAAAVAELETAENDLNRMRKQLELTMRFVRQAEEKFRKAEQNFDSNCTR